VKPSNPSKRANLSSNRIAKDGTADALSVQAGASRVAFTGRSLTGAKSSPFDKKVCSPMPRRLSTALALIFVSLVSLQAQDLTDQQIADAIAAGTAARVTEFVVFINGAGPFDLQMVGPMGRVALAAWQARGQGRTFTAADIVPDVKTARWLVVITPNLSPFRHAHPERTNVMAQLTRVESIPSPPTHVVMSFRGSHADLVQPESEHTEAVAWFNSVGGRRDGQSLIALFDPAKLPGGTFTVVVNAQGLSPISVTVNEQDRARLR
jgi:hypothetical protein